MLVLDEALSASLLSIAASEGKARHEIDQASLYSDPTTSKFLAKGQTAKHRHQVLWDLLLHYPAVLSPFDNLNFSELQRLGLVSDQLDGESQSVAYRQLHDTPELVRAVDQFILADLRASHPILVSQGAVDTFIQLLGSDGYRIASGLESAMFGSYATFDEYVEGTKSMFGDAMFRLPGPGNPQLISGAEFGAQIAGSANREDFGAFKRYEPHIEFMQDFSRSAQRWLALIHSARSNKAVLSAAVPDGFLSAASRAGDVPARLRKAADSGSTHAAVRLWLEEVECVPNLNSIDDVLRLREDKRIDAFRDAMNEWASSLASGSTAEEKRLRQSVRSANKQLARLAGAQKSSKFWTIASIPLDVLLALSPVMGGLPIPVTGIVGLGISLALDSKAKALDWVMFGRG